MESLQNLEDDEKSDRFRRLLPYIEMSVEPPEVEVDLLQRIHGMSSSQGRSPNESRVRAFGPQYVKGTWSCSSVLS